MKKDYNPFKMWGSYLGGILSGLGAYFYIKTVLNSYPSINIPLYIFFISMDGFLIGWLIHGFLRSIK